MMYLVIAVSLVLGSFANNVITYFTNKAKFDLWRSYCICGDRVLKYYELFPLLSYLLQRGKCNYCEKKIPARYIIIETLTLAIGSIIFLMHGASNIFALVFIADYLFLCIAVIDFYSYIIPNLLVLALLFISTLKGMLSEPDFLLNIFISIGLVIFFLLVNQISKKVKKTEAIGYGDIKLIAVINLFFGYQIFLILLWLSSLIAIPGFYVIKSFRKKYPGETKIPFGFFLGAGSIIVSIFDERILPLFYNLVGV